MILGKSAGESLTIVLSFLSNQLYERGEEKHFKDKTLNLKHGNLLVSILVEVPFS